MFTSDDLSTITDDTSLVDLDGDGIYETAVQEFDTDGDGQFDSWAVATDLDNDGYADEVSVVESIDTDGDGQFDTLEVSSDLDNNGVIDEVVNVDYDQYSDLIATQVEDDSIIGDPENDLDNWHQQTYEDTCAIASQEFILDELTGQDFSEDELRQEAIENGWYTPGGGTPMESMGNLLEAHGIDVEREYGCTLENLAVKLDAGQNVMVALDAEEIWYPDGQDTDDLLSNVAGMPEQGANHAVQVVGIDNSDPDNPMVILNDPGSANGQGLVISAEQFMNAWEDSDRYMVYTTGDTYQGDKSTVAQVDIGDSMLGDYYDDPVEYETSWGDYYADWGDKYAYAGYDSSTCYDYATDYYDNAAWEAEHSY